MAASPGPLLRRATAAGQWGALGAPASWGSVDLRSTDPMRSNSGQLTLALWCRGQEGRACAAGLRRAVYRPARSTDILLQEFISGGPNEGDLAMVYEASALARQGEASRQRPGGYVLLFPDPTFETILAAAVLRGQAAGRADDGERFVAFLRSTEGPRRCWAARASAQPMVGGQPSGPRGAAPAPAPAPAAGGAAAPLATGGLRPSPPLVSAITCWRGRRHGQKRRIPGVYA